MGDLTDESVLAIGCWDPRYARVLDVQVEGDFGAALVDANGDRADVNIDLYERDVASGWVNVASGNGSSIRSGQAVATRTGDDRLIVMLTEDWPE